MNFNAEQLIASVQKIILRVDGIKLHSFFIPDPLGGGYLHLSPKGNTCRRVMQLEGLAGRAAEQKSPASVQNPMSSAQTSLIEKNLITDENTVLLAVPVVQEAELIGIVEVSLPVSVSAQEAETQKPEWMATAENLTPLFLMFQESFLFQRKYDRIKPKLLAVGCLTLSEKLRLRGFSFCGIIDKWGKYIFLF